MYVSLILNTTSVLNEAHVSSIEAVIMQKRRIGDCHYYASVPDNKLQLISCLGLTGFYAKFVLNFSTKVSTSK